MTGFIVLYDDNRGLCYPMGWDADCQGAICCWSKEVAVFPSRKDAQKAIRISHWFTLLCKAQGKPENTDFTEGRKHLKIVKLAPKESVN